MAEGKKQMTFWNRLSYAVSTVPNYMSQFSASMFLPVFLLEVVQLPPAHVTVVTATSRVLWGLTFPLVGYLVNRTNTRWGKLRPWRLVAVLPVAVTFFFMWFSVGTSGETSKLVWYLFFACAFFSLSTAYGVPQNSLVMFATDEPRERDILNAFAVGGTSVALIAGAVIPGQTLSAFGAPVGYDPCTNGTNGTHPGASLSVQKNAFMVSAAAISGIYVMCGLVGVFGVPERKDVKADNRLKSGLHYRSVLKHMFTFRPFICQLLLTGCLVLGGELLGSNFSLTIQYSFGMEDYTAILLPVTTGINILSLIPCYWLLKKLGRKTFLIGGMIVTFVPFCIILMIATPAMLGSALVPTVFATCSWGSIASQISILAPIVMITDVIDAFKLKTGEGMETIFYSILLLINGIASAIAQALSNGLLQLADYDPNACVQSPSVGLYLKYLVSIIPGAFFFLALFVAWLNPITEETRKRTKLGLDFLKNLED